MLLKTTTWIILDGKQIPPDTVLEPGRNITEKQVDSLATMGPEIEIIDQGPPDRTGQDKRSK